VRLPCGEKDAIRVVAIKFAAQTIEGLRMKPRGKEAMLVRPSSKTLGTLNSMEERVVGASSKQTPVT